MKQEQKIHYISICPICGEPIYPYPADYDSPCHIVHKTAKEQIEEREERVALLENTGVK